MKKKAISFLTAFLTAISCTATMLPTITGTAIAASTSNVKFDEDEFYVAVGTCKGATQLRYFAQKSEGGYTVEKVVWEDAPSDLSYGDVFIADGDAEMTKVMAAPDNPVYAMAYYYQLDENAKLDKVGKCEDFMEQKELTVTSKIYDGSAHWSIRYKDSEGKEYYYGLSTFASTLTVNPLDCEVGDVYTYALYNDYMIVPLAKKDADNDVTVTTPTTTTTANNTTTTTTKISTGTTVTSTYATDAKGRILDSEGNVLIVNGTSAVMSQPANTTTTTTAAPNGEKVTAVIMSINDTKLLLKPDKGSDILNISDRFTMAKKLLNEDITPAVGMKLEIIFPGSGFLTTYPAQLSRVNNVTVVSEVPEITTGDANCDDQTDMADAVLIMQALANPDKYGENGSDIHHLTGLGKLNGDTDGDGLTVGDALAIQRKLLGLDKEEKSFSATLLGIDKAKVTFVKVSSLPEGYDYSFTDENAQAVVDYLSNISLSTNLSVEDPGQLGGMTWVIKLKYENGDTVTLYDLGKFIHGTNRKWYEMTYEESQELSNLIWKLGKTDNDKSIDNSEYLIGNEPSGSVMKPQRLALNCNSFCANGETLKIQMLMGDIYTYNQEHNSYPNFDSEGNPEYTIFATENYKKIDDERLVVNGAKSEYTKAFTKEDMKSLDITGKEGDYTAYYTDTAEIDFSSYPSGSTGCISVSFGWKADGVNPHNTSSDFDGTSQTIYFYVGENGTGISNNGIEAAQKAYEDKSDDDIMFYDSIYVKWNGKEVMSNLYDMLRKPSDKVIPINFKLSMSPDYNFEYKGKKLSEYANANYSEEMMKLKDLQMYGNQLKYGETIYTTGTPDGTKRTKEWYEERVEYFGEELLSKYIVDGEFLEEKLRVNINELMKNNRIANEEAEKAYYSYISDEAIKQLDKQNIKYEYMTEPKRLVIYVTAEEFKAMKLDNVSRYGLDTSVAKGLTVNAIA